MSLFVTRIPRDIEPVELEDRFRKFGEVVRFKLIEGKGYGFVEFQEKGDAENAIESLNGQEVFGERIVVEWSKSSGGGGGGGAGGPGGARPRGRGCYNCGEEGHMSRECTRPPAPGAGRGAGGGGGGRGCFKCGEEGHFARDCTNPSASNGGGGGAPYERRRDDYGPSYSRRSPRRYDDRRERSPGRYDDRRDRSPRRYDDRRFAEDSRPPRYDRYDRDRPSYGRDSGYMSNGDRDRSYSKRDHSPPPPPSGDGPARGSPRRYEDNVVAPAAAPPPHASDAPGDNGW